MLVFDLDDTLYLERDFAFSGFAAVGTYLEAEYGVTGVENACRNRFLNGEYEFIFNRVLEDSNVSPTPVLIRDLIRIYRFHTPRIALCPDVLAFLGRRQIAPPMGLITDGPKRMQRAKIAALELGGWLSHIRPTDEWGGGFEKPHPRAFEEVEALGFAPADLTYVADNPAKDFITPKARGWRTVQITRPGGVHDPDPPDRAHEADHQIASFEDLEVVLGL